MTQRTPTPARQFGRYELTELIAIGGMGEIHLARLRGAANFEKRCVIKKILPHLATEPEFVARFIDEANLVVQLSHGNIVPVFDMGEHDGQYYIAMDFVDGVDLRTILRRLADTGRRLPVAMAVHVACEVCKGLGYAHRKTDDDGRSLGIIHRDVSPSNILISRDGEVKLVDFGIAKARSSSSRSVSGRLQGKFGYMSPEQARGEALDPRSDVFSTGVVLYEMLTGVRPFHADSDLETLERVRTHRPPAPGTHRDDIPSALDDLVLRALSTSPANRFDSADALLEALMAFLSESRQTVTALALAGELGEVLEPDREAPAGARPRFEDLLDLEADRLLAGDGRQTSTASLELEAVDDDRATVAAATTATASLSEVTPAPPGEASEPATAATTSGLAPASAAHQLDATPDSPNGAVADSGVIASGPLPTQEPPPQPRVSRLLAGAIGLLAVAILAFVAWQITRDTDPSEASERATDTSAPATRPAPETTLPIADEVSAGAVAPDPVETEAPAEPAEPATFTFSVTPTSATVEATGTRAGWRELPGTALPAFEVEPGRLLSTRIAADGHQPCDVLVTNAPEGPSIVGPACAGVQLQDQIVVVKLEPLPDEVGGDPGAADSEPRPTKRPRHVTPQVTLNVRGPSTYRIEVDGKAIDDNTFEFARGVEKVSISVIPGGKHLPWRKTLRRPDGRATSIDVEFGQLSIQLRPHELEDGTDVAVAAISFNGRQLTPADSRVMNVWVPIGDVEVIATNKGDQVGASRTFTVGAGEHVKDSLQLAPLD